jgi:hypothetical protein
MSSYPDEYLNASLNDSHSDPFDNGSQCQPFRSSYECMPSNHPDVRFNYSVITFPCINLGLSKCLRLPVYFQTLCQRLSPWPLTKR